MNDFLMGADPEIVFVTANGEIIPANNHLRIDGQLGVDGHIYLAELRPPPGSPEQVVENIRNILNTYHKRIPDYAYWLGGTYICDKAIGGHIHFGLRFTENLPLALDGKLSQILTLLEDRREAIHRRSANYGGLYSYHRDAVRWPGGQGGRHFEYRTPACFIVSPSIALGVYALAKSIVWEELANGKYALDRLKGDTRDTILEISEDAYRNCDRQYFLNRFPTVWDTVRRHLYWYTTEGRNLWRYTALLKDLIQQGKTWHNGFDLLERWKVIPVREERFNLPDINRDVEVPEEALDDVDLFDRIWARPVIGPRIMHNPPVRARRVRFAEVVDDNPQLNHWAEPIHAAQIDPVTFTRRVATWDVE